MGQSHDRIFRRITRRMVIFFKHVKIVIYKFCIRSKYAPIRFDTYLYGEAARGF